MKNLRFLLLLAAALCALQLPAISAPSALEGVEWTLTELSGKPFAAPDGGRGAPTLRLDTEKKRAGGSGGVNTFGGSFERNGDKLKFGPLMSTRRGGPPEVMAVESAFHAMLASVTGWRIDDGALALLSEGKVVARFSGRPAGQK